MVLQVNNGTFQFAPATGRNSYGSFTALWETVDAPAAPPQKPASAPNFTDVKSSDYFATPVKWAVSKGITNGTTATAFSPNSTCTRGQIVTFLHRYFVEPLDNSAFIASVTKPASSDPMNLDLWAQASIRGIL